MKRNLEKVWNYQKDFETGLAYSIGLILVKGKPYLKAISTETGIKVINYSEYLREEMRYWETDLLFKIERELCDNGGRIILDEVIFPKENTTEMDAHIVHCSSQKRRLLGQEYLVLIWVKEDIVRVIGFIKVKKDDERLKLSIELLDRFLKLGKTITGLSADGWFFKEGFVKDLKEREISFVSRPRKDSWWYLGNEEIQLKKYVQTIDKGSFHHYAKEKVYAKSIIVANQEYGYCKVVILKPKHSTKPDDYLFIVSTDKNSTVREIIKAYKIRWKIEIVFRDCSQNLGLKDCQAYKKASETHVAIVFLTYNFLSSIKEKEGGTIGMIKRKLINTCKPITTNITAFNNLKMVA